MLRLPDGVGPMCFCSALAVRHERSFLTILCVLAMLVSALCANAQTTDPDRDDDLPAPQAKDITRHDDAKKIAKYDVTRIGSRGIGHAFNMYSLKRERQLGESLAADFDRSSRIVTDPALNDYVNSVAQRLV